MQRSRLDRAGRAGGVPLLAEVRDTSDDAEVHAAAIEAIRALGS